MLHLVFIRIILTRFVCIQVERALTFWHDGHVTLNGVNQGSKTFSIRKYIDPNTGKETKATEFNQAKWGTATNGYLNSIKSNIACGKFDWASSLKAASKFKKPGRHRDSMVASLMRFVRSMHEQTKKHKQCNKGLYMYGS